MNSPKLPPSPTSKPTAAETPNSSRIIKKAEFISPSLFYQQGQMSIECPNQKVVMAIIRDYVGGTRRYPLPDLVGTGITAEEWNRQLDVWGKVIEDNPVAGKAKRYVQNLQKRCFACRCNPETARLVHETNALLSNPCSNRMIALKCEVYFQCACTVPLIQPTFNATYRSVPLRYFQDAINRIPRYIRERAGDDWIWEVPSSMAEYEGQILRFTTPLWDPPSLPLENSEPLEPYFDVDRSLWADHDPNDPNPPPIRLYGPQANPVNLDFDLDDFLDFTGTGDQDMFDVPPGLEYEHGLYRVNEGDLETEKPRMKRN
ncbi:hypothetical protein TWF225_008499 [Orbilia oligospora]|nr:hypothetical protein TWF225_008499 [Orbilia oligospora]KAF3245747.1 hypothetical protein TWF217_010370 [Orbilia oligospora]KAF3288916.1 hypothetical protein TWF132_007790 [Orbilia oligospora]